MPKIKTLKITAKGQTYAININCTSRGLFTANIPDEVSLVLGIDKRLEEDTLDQVEDKINTAFADYIESQTKQELFIAIEYKASRKFAENAKGGRLFPYHGNKFNRSSFSDDNYSDLSFGFNVVIKETTEDRVRYYDTRLENVSGDPLEKAYQKRHVIHSHKKMTLIPYTDESFNRLKVIEEKLRVISETLFDFVTREPEVIAGMLLNSNLLGQ